MLHLNERTAEALTPEQAVTVVRLLDLQARWENHRDDPGKSALSAADLRARQKAFEVYWSARREYAARRGAPLPEPTQNAPAQLAAWCRTLRAVFRRAGAGDTAQVMVKVSRLVGRVAARTGRESVDLAPVGSLETAVGELDAVIAWCDALAAPSSDSLPFREGTAA
jgi:hypothetical protein